MGPTDYFTREQFRDWSGDRDPTPRYADDDIDEGQEQVIDLLENWAFTAWPDVTGGLATGPRSVTEYFNGPQYLGVMLNYLPIISITAITLDSGDGSGPQPFTGYILDPLAGTITFGMDYTTAWTPAWVGGIPFQHQLAVSYQYGFTETPRTVRNACMQATKSLLDQESGRSKIPPGLASYSTETARFVFRWRTELPEDIRYEPWPWDYGATDRINTLWKSRHPKTLMWKA